MKKKSMCRVCGGPITWTAKIRHAHTGKVIYAWQYGIRAFPICSNEH